GPALDRRRHVAADVVPVVQRDAERGADVGEPAVEDGRGVALDRVREGAPQLPLLGGDDREPRAPHVAPQPLEMAREGRIRRRTAPIAGVTNFVDPREAATAAGLQCCASVMTTAAAVLRWADATGSPTIRAGMASARAGGTPGEETSMRVDS